MFSQLQVVKSVFNVLQLAIYNQKSMFPFVRYLLKEHQTITSSRQSKLVDPRIILSNSFSEEDETLTLRLALQLQHMNIFQLLWDDFFFLYTERHLYTIAKYLFSLELYDQLNTFLSSGTTQTLFLRSSNERRQDFLDLFAPDRLGAITEQW